MKLKKLNQEMNQEFFFHFCSLLIRSTCLLVLNKYIFTVHFVSVSAFMVMGLNDFLERGDKSPAFSSVLFLF